MSLTAFEMNLRSQNGEDGVIAEIFHRIGRQSSWAVELGAWDGERLSNIWNLWTNQDWNALLIEGDGRKYEHLLAKIAPFPRVKAWNAYVTPEGENSLDVIFANAGLPREIDLLSIDIDGDDYWLLHGLRHTRPRVVIIEFNPTIPADVSAVQKPGQYFGASAKSLVELGHERGYKLAHVTKTNVFLVRDDDFAKLGFAEPSLSDFPDCFTPIYLMTAFDGSAWISHPAPFGIQATGRTPKGRVNLKSLSRFLKGCLPGRPAADEVFEFAAPDGARQFRRVRVLQ